MPDRFRKWVRGLRPESRPSSRASAPVPASTPLQPEPPSVDPKATSPANAAIDNLTVALGLVQQVANIVRNVPFIAPAAALMSELLKVYKEVKDTDDKRAVLLANITGLARDLCGTILRMEATNHVDLIRRLKADIEAYAEWAFRSVCWFIRQCDNQGITKHVAARNELGSEMNALNRELDSFGASFRENSKSGLACPDMRQKQLETLELRHKGTGHWLLEGNKFTEWQDNPGSLWIRGASVRPISKSLQGSGRADKSKSNGQTLPTYQELEMMLEALLLEFGGTYIVLDALDECQQGDQRRLPAPPNLTEAFDDVTCIELESDLTEEDIRLFVESELQRLEPWASRAADLVVSKSNGMFRMAACLIVETSHCPWEDKLDKTLDNLPNDLFEIYDRFLQAIRPEHLLYAQAALQWFVFSQEELTLEKLADAVAFPNTIHLQAKSTWREQAHDS
ncbi:hypothetical protein DFH09DRAFT_1112657 [Mycena vulgaris]|nr:hypothetical protein DFH09DRAFT_1112657 [Mycena vulgaris]